MTIREAVELVLISSQLESKKNAEIFILEMGKPVLIKDLAKRMIVLHGKNENEIKIEYTGLRKGEKVSEELFFKEEKVVQTKMDGILRTTDKIFVVNPIDYDNLLSNISQNNTKKAVELQKNAS